MSLKLTYEGFQKLDLKLSKSNLSLNNQGHKTGQMRWIMGSLGSRDVLDSLN